MTTTTRETYDNNGNVIATEQIEVPDTTYPAEAFMSSATKNWKITIDDSGVITMEEIV